VLPVIESNCCPVKEKAGIAEVGNRAPTSVCGVKSPQSATAALTGRTPVCYGDNVLTQNSLGQPHRAAYSYWWWYVRAEEAVC